MHTGSTINSGLINVSTTQPDALFLMQGSFNYNASGSTFNGRVFKWYPRWWDMV
ncbi:MAG: hypothetical protein KatS3mg035_0784 [Bacteroidia bacterium]|nr:MAG: hypothetical protein KatS3mg035_0784 [Bacteroidia bacterium]